MQLSIDEINKNLGLINWNNAKKEKLVFDQVSIDSRSINSTDLFIAINGTKYNGHFFVEESIRKGVKAIVVNKGSQHYVPKGFPYWAVKDTLWAYQVLALCKRKKLNIPVIAITGSVGKTTTKEIAGEVLSRYGKIKLSENNNNNEIGVSLTIHSCDKTHKLLVLEMGMRGLGQIEILSKFSQPDIAVITNIGSSHIGLLGSRDNIAKAKTEITKYLNPRGTLIIPEGEPLLEKYLKNSWRGKIIRVKILNFNELDQNYKKKENFIQGFYCKSRNMIKIEGSCFYSSLRGKYNALNFLYIYAISKELGIQFEALNNFNFKIMEGRNKILSTQKLTIMDETYNASPESVKACIDLLLDLPGKHFLVLGSMKELGIEKINYHKEIISFANIKKIDGFILLCDHDLEIELRNTDLFDNKIEFVNKISEIVKLLDKWTSKGDSLLIKGSRYWELENLIKIIN